MAQAGAGERDALVRFERAVMEPEDAGGERESGDWTLIERAMAKVRLGSSAERREAGAQSASQVATFRVLSTAALRTVTPTDCRIVWKGNWNVTGDAPIESAGEIEFTAVRNRG